MREVFNQLLENSLIHYELIQYLPSTVAAAALCLAQRLLPTLLPVEPVYWLVEIFSGSSELADIQRCFVDMSLWHHSWENQSVANVADSTQVPPVSMSSTSENMVGGLFYAAEVDFYSQFSNFSITPQ